MRLNFTISLLACFALTNLLAQSGFNTTASSWPVPQGGSISSIATYGYDALGGSANSNITGDQSWSVIDINGDGKPDLVITAEEREIPGYSVATVFGQPNTPYWKVYLNNGNGFNGTPVNWSIPQGGNLSSYVTYGYHALAGSANTNIAGDQSWSVIDINGDSKPDLVVTAEERDIPGYSVATVFGQPNTPYWKVYLNNGNGFNGTPVNWVLPQGGSIGSIATYGFDALGGSASTNIAGDQSWSVIDLNSDNKPDLVVTAEERSIPGYSVATVFGQPNTPYWKVYFNNGNGFNTTPVNWALPQGGSIGSIATYGYDALGGSANSNITGDQSWSVIDLNSDNKPDLVVTAEERTIPGYSVATVFGQPNTPYWKVYLNNGNGFNTTPVNWALPQGGSISSIATYGYDALGGSANSNITGDQSWSVIDLNSDNKPDLVITAEERSIPGYSVATVFGQPNTPYWKVYLNNGNGFNGTPYNWTLPQGGSISSIVAYGYDALGGSANSNITGDQSWSVIDLNSDNKPDLVITAEERQIPGYSVATVFGQPNAPHWNVFLNTAAVLRTDHFMDGQRDIVVYPNPSNGKFHIQAASEKVAVTVYDLAGRKVLEHAGTTIDLSNYTKGMYLFNIQAGDEIIVKKVVLE